MAVAALDAILVVFVGLLVLGLVAAAAGGELDSSGWHSVAERQDTKQVEEMALRIGDGRILHNLTHPFQYQTAQAWGRKSPTCGSCTGSTCYPRQVPQRTMPHGQVTHPRLPAAPTPANTVPSFDAQPMVDLTKLKQRVGTLETEVANIRAARPEWDGVQTRVRQLEQSVASAAEQSRAAAAASSDAVVRIEQQTATVDQKLHDTRSEVASVVKQGAVAIAKQALLYGLMAGTGGGGAIYLAGWGASAIGALLRRRRARRAATEPANAPVQPNNPLVQPSTAPVQTTAEPAPSPQPPQVETKYVTVTETDKLGDAYREAVDREARYQGQRGNSGWVTVAARIHDTAKALARRSRSHPDPAHQLGHNSW